MKFSFTEYPIAHIGFVVSDRDATVERITTLFDITEWKVYTFRPGKTWCYGKQVSDYELKIAMGTPREGTCKIEVIEPVSLEGTHYDVVHEGREGMHHFAYTVKDYDHWAAHFKENGAEVIFESETEDDVIGYRRCIYVEDKELGCVYEIMEEPYFRK